MSLDDIHSLVSDVFDECTEDDERGGWAQNSDYGKSLSSPGSLVFEAADVMKGPAGIGGLLSLSGVQTEFYCRTT